MISEVWANGRKHRSFIKGIGNETAVQSAYASATAALNESVLFEFSDASGMSYRTTDKLGAEVATGDGGEGSPIETDPLGGSVGTSTPYSDPFAYVPDPEFPDLIPYNHGGPNIPGQDFASLYATFGSRIADLPGFGSEWGSFLQLDEAEYAERLENSRLGLGFVTYQEYSDQAYADAATQTETGTDSEGTNGSGNSGGSWVDQDTADVDLDTNTVTVYGDGYWNLATLNVDWGAWIPGTNPTTIQPPVSSPGSLNTHPQEKCPVVPIHPSNAGIDKNIATSAENGVGSAWNPLKPIYDLKAFVWFRDQVRNKGPWDYKQQGRQYQDFGNFNYGASGLALGIDETTLLREAGRAQQAAGTSKPEWGDPGYRWNPFGGSGSYGDDPDDQQQINLGFEYYKALKRGCVK